MSNTDKITQLRKIVADCQHAKIDGVLVDLFTASAVVQVYDALNETNREKFASLDILRMVDLTWDLVG